jgi:hypothetical protein
MVGNNLAIAGPGNISRNVLIGDDSSSGGTNTAQMGHNNSIGNAVDVFAIGGFMSVGDGSAFVIIGGYAITVGLSVLNVVAIGNNITLPDSATESVVIGDTAYAANSSVAIGQQAQVGIAAFPLLGGGGNVALGALCAVGIDTSNSGAIVNSAIDDSSSNSLAIVSSHIFANVPNSAAVANSSIDHDSAFCLAVVSSTIGDNCISSLALVGSNISPGVTGGLAIAGSTVTGNQSVAIAGATAAANEVVIGDSVAALAFHTFVVRGFDTIALSALDTIKAIDNPASGETGLSVVYNNGASQANKTLKVALNPPVGALIVYVDP